MAADEEDAKWAGFEVLKKAIEEQRQRSELGTVVQPIEGDNDAEIQYWRELGMLRYLEDNQFGRCVDMRMLQTDRYRYWDRLAARHHCTKTCSFRTLSKNMIFRLSNNKVYRASGDISVCETTLKPHFCGPDVCGFQTLPPDGECTVCTLTGRMLSENVHYSTAQSRTDPDIGVAGDFVYERHHFGDNTRLSCRGAGEPDLYTKIRETTRHDADALYCLERYRDSAGTMNAKQVLELASTRRAHRSLAERVYDEHVMANVHVEHQVRRIKQSHLEFEAHATAYVKECAERHERWDLMEVMKLFNHYTKPDYQGVYFNADMDSIKRELRDTVVDCMLSVWDRLLQAEYTQKQQLAFAMCVQGILVILAGHSTDHKHGMRIQLKVHRGTNKPERITEVRGIEEIDLQEYEIQEFQFIPRIPNLVLAPPGIINQQPKPSTRRQNSRNTRSVTHMIVSSRGHSRNRQSKSQRSAASKSTGSAASSSNSKIIGRMPSIKHVHCIIADIITNAKTPQDIRRFCCV